MFLIAGCVPSLHPLYTEKDITFEPSLIGTWSEEGKEDESKWTFKKSGDNAYELILTEGGRIIFSQDGTKEKEIISKFDVHLVRLGEFLFMDMCPLPPESGSYFYNLHLIPSHTIWKVWIEGDILRITWLDYNWLKDMLNQKKINIAHECLGDEPDPRIVLTASTKELQEFVLKYAEDVKAFPEPGELRRLK